MLVDPRFGARMRELMARTGMSYRALAAHTYYGKSYLYDLASGAKQAPTETARRLDEALGAGGELVALLPAGPSAQPSHGDALDALELARRVTASDVSAETLARLDEAVDTMAMAYAKTPPADLLPRVRRHLAYVARLVGARKTVDQHRRLLVAGGWLSLLAATLDIDLRRKEAAEAWLSTAAQMAEHAGHAEIQAWCLETRAWDALTVGNYRTALELSQHAQAVAPQGSSAYIQATAQEGRAWARMRQPAETRDALNRVARLVAGMPAPDQPEHHYKYDPSKAISYTATTLSWVGDPAAETYARHVVQELASAPDGVARPRRVASARLDLGLALLAAGRPEEAAAEAVEAITSGRVVPSNWWRAAEVVSGVEQAGVGEAAELREAYQSFDPRRNIPTRPLANGGQ